MRSNLNRNLLRRDVLRVVAGEHVHTAGVFVVDRQQTPLALSRQKREEAVVVAVEAKLLRRNFGSLTAQAELGSAGQDRIAPANNDVRAVPGRDVDPVIQIMRNALQAHRA